jgi:hypothetical protein
MASLAPFDGWAEGQQCAGESKDFLYPNNRAATLWYHDHALDITGANNIFGLAGQYIVSLLTRDGGCGAPFGLESIPGDAEHSMLIGVSEYACLDCRNSAIQPVTMRSVRGIKNVWR